jgi:signal transduction histidine kinase
MAGFLSIPALGELRRLLGQDVPPGHGDEDGVRRQWWAALATLQEDLLTTSASPQGVWLASPLPALYEPALLQRLQGWVWAPPDLSNLLQSSAPQLPGGPAGAAKTNGADALMGLRRLALLKNDGTDPLLIVITPRLQVGLALEGPPEGRRLLVRFDAAVLSSALKLLDRRLQQQSPADARQLRQALQALGSLDNDPGLALRFWPLLAQRLASMAPSVTLQPMLHPRRRHQETATSPEPKDEELALLEALTHEVRTPLATIRTLIRSLLRRSDLPTVVRQRLEQIDSECSEQIDRFGLIFLAAELQRQPGSGQPLAASDLARTDLSQLLHQLEELWQRQLQRRDLRLELTIAAELPPVLSDPSRLATMLGGLMDRFSRSLPSGRLVRLSLQPAGARLKLQLASDEPEAPAGGPSTAAVEGVERVGPVLSWNPATGSLQLSDQATRQLFHRLGGRLTERGGTSLTVFFPVCRT